jgi:DnaJ family protein C protein 19
MPFMLIIIAAALGWAVWSGKLRMQQVPPVVLGLAGVFALARGAFIPGVALVGVAATWYRGLTWRLFGASRKQSRQDQIDNARMLLGANRNDDEEMIRNRHRLLIQQNHPDTGGTDERASALNEARDLLLADIKEH